MQSPASNSRASDSATEAPKSLKNYGEQLARLGMMSRAGSTSMPTSPALAGWRGCATYRPAARHRRPLSLRLAVLKIALL